MSLIILSQNSRRDERSKGSSHLQAMSVLLHLRGPLDRNTTAASALAFERICVESFIYHSATTMLFDIGLGLVYVVPQLVEKFASCFTSGSIPRNEDSFEDFYHSPILGAPSVIFIVLMEATQLAQSLQPLTVDALNNVWLRYSQLQDWE